MCFAFLLESRVLCVFHCPLLIEDTHEASPTPTEVAPLGDSIQGSTYISINLAVIASTALVLMSQRKGVTLSATKQSPAVVDLVDDQGDKVKMKALNQAYKVYPDTPNINLFPLLHGILPSYAAHNNHDVAKAFPVDTADLQTWPQL